VKVLGVFGIGLLLFLGAFFWPSLHSDWHYWTKKREYRELRIGEPKERVRAAWGLPLDTHESDVCWTDHVSRWPGATRVYTLCFAHGRLVSKTFNDE
jgi:hypothetical protein